MMMTMPCNTESNNKAFDCWYIIICSYFFAFMCPTRWTAAVLMLTGSFYIRFTGAVWVILWGHPVWCDFSLIYGHFNITSRHSMIPWLNRFRLFVVVVGKDDCNNYTENHRGWYCYHQANDEGIVETNNHAGHEEEYSYDGTNHQGIILGVAAGTRVEP